MICNGAPITGFPALELYNEYWRSNLAMLYAWCAFYNLPTEWLDHYRDLIPH